MTAVAPETRADAPAPGRSRGHLNLALLGLGQIGSAVAKLASDPPAAVGWRFRIGCALVRDVHRRRDPDVAVTADPARLFASNPDVVVEVLGGVEPARTLVIAALERGIPVVTANKSLLAACGDELHEIAARSRAALRYEASVLAGVPFLGTFAERPFAAAIAGLTGIVNGTSNYIVSRMAAGETFEEALERAVRQGYAEPDASNDIDGVDAAEKLVVLLRHFSGRTVRTSDLEVRSIRVLTRADLEQARDFGGTIRPVATARFTDGRLSAWVGPAWIPSRDPLAGVDGVTNAIRLERTGLAALMFSGPGAGPAATAATILDDVVEVAASGARAVRSRRPQNATPRPPDDTGWFVRLRGFALPGAVDICDFLGSYGIWPRRVSERSTTEGRETRWILTHPAATARIEEAAAALDGAAGCDVLAVRALEAGDE